ncbi:anti-sigma F factor [uncultured Clostridium sp.]|uniref:anti-sigma F factor n=1 Tax=uncultured Clostridium sp. TaxID=59620 RepID=UPI0026223E5F|nr:anti-sigma F factor [uncultured Clostridium sp.]
MNNKVKIEFLAKSENESFARIAVAGLVAQLDPTIDELADIKTAVSEAVTNSIIHGYQNDETKTVYIDISIQDDEVEVVVFDRGIGIEDVEQAKEALYTSRPDLERSGMGFTVMESFMDSLVVESDKDCGTKLIMKKKIKKVV